MVAGDKVLLGFPRGTGSVADEASEVKDVSCRVSLPLDSTADGGTDSSLDSS
jgi:hypothetical protein